MATGLNSSPAGVVHPSMAWTSFDRYARYAAITRALRANLGPGRHRVLDVGDCAGHLTAFDEDLDVVGLDVQIPSERLDRAAPIRGDGTRLPFRDGSFDAVVSSDVLEHVPMPRRAAFLAELGRVSRDLVVVAAPFDTPGVAGVEELVRRYAGLTLGTPQPQLEEHRDNGLPSLDDTVAALAADRPGPVVAGNGNLWDWLAFMLLRFQLEARPALKPLSDGYDIFYNSVLAERSDIGPFYRNLVIARRGAPGRTGLPQGTPAEDAPGSSTSEPFPAAVLGALLAADSSEVARQDTVPRLDQLIHELSELRTTLEGVRTEQTVTRDELTAVSASLGAVDHRLGVTEAQLSSVLRFVAPLHLRVRSRLPEGLRRRLRQARAAARALVGDRR